MSTTIIDGKSGSTIVHSNPGSTPVVAGKGTAIVTTTTAVSKDGIAKTASVHGEVAGANGVFTNVVLNNPA